MVTNNAANIPTGNSSTILQAQGDGVAHALSTATYPSTATSTGTILRANGTNWVPSTATYPDTAGTSGNILTSNGTNWTSAAAPASSGILTASGTLTNAQIKALHATPIQVIASPGANAVISILSAIGTMNYGGTNVFTAAAAQTVRLYLGAGTTNIATNPLISNAMIIASSSQVNSVTPQISDSSTVYSTVSNQAVYLYNNSLTEISGNAANDNTISYNIIYQIITI